MYSLEPRPLIPEWIKQKQMNSYSCVGEYHNLESVAQFVSQLGDMKKDSIVTLFAGSHSIAQLISAPNVIAQRLIVHIAVKNLATPLGEIAFAASSGATIFISTTAAQVQRHSILAFLASANGPVLHFYHSDENEKPQPVLHIELSLFREAIANAKGKTFPEFRSLLMKFGVDAPSSQIFGPTSEKLLVCFAHFIEEDWIDRLNTNGVSLIQIFQVNPLEFSAPPSVKNVELLLPIGFEWSPHYLSVAMALRSNPYPPDISLVRQDSPFHALTPKPLFLEKSGAGIEPSIIAFLSSCIPAQLKLYQSEGSLENSFGSLLADSLDKQSGKVRWLIDDGTSLDMGNSFVHTIISSKEDLNLLVVDKNPRDSSTSAFKNRRDVGLYAMNYGGVFVASICPSYSFSQANRAILEASAHKGPSVVILLSPILSGPQSSAVLDRLAICKRVIDSGVFSLYRWTPSVDGNEPNLQVDSSKAKANFDKFLERESNLSLMVQSSNENNKLTNVETQLERQVLEKAHESYQQLFGNLVKKRLLILYGSDGGNAEGLAKVIGVGAKEKGLFVKTFAADTFVTEDLVREENILFVVSTAGQGEFPSNIRETWKTLATAEFDLSPVKYSVFALGDRHYWPRPEDAHYFAKSGKDLDERIAKLGGQRLTSIGVGDDRDPDGYFTGYNKWAPNFWTSLGVDSEAVATSSVIPSDDAIKAASNYLRGTIAEGLLDETTGALAEYDTKLTKFHGIYQQDDRDIREHRARMGMEKAFSFMIRVRVPGGVATAAQYLAMDEISDKWANSTIKITTRQGASFFLQKLFNSMEYSRVF